MNRPIATFDSLRMRQDQNQVWSQASCPTGITAGLEKERWKSCWNRNVHERNLGQCQEIFDFRFFHESVSPKSLSTLQGRFEFFGKFAEILAAQGAPPVPLNLRSIYFGKFKRSMLPVYIKLLKYLCVSFIENFVEIQVTHSTDKLIFFKEQCGSLFRPGPSNRIDNPLLRAQYSRSGGQEFVSR